MADALGERRRHKEMSRRIGSSQLAPNLLLAAYSEGYFPMAESRTGPIGWHSPDPRAIIPLDHFRTSRSLRQVLARGTFATSVNRAFAEVIRACAGRAETWISEEIIEAYTELHRLGHAHSLETWSNGVLSGGLYGVSIGGAFFGESMFSREPNASKVALATLVGRLQNRGYTLLDAQFMTDHLRQFGTVEISRDDYLAMLREALRIRAEFSESGPSDGGM
jgi:leucyl/phenylalanyl-tRNA---protein transferase